MKCPFIKYRNILGEPGKGVHRFRFLNSAVVDYILTLLKNQIFIQAILNVTP